MKIALQDRGFVNLVIKTQMCWQCLMLRCSLSFFWMDFITQLDVRTIIQCAWISFFNYILKYQLHNRSLLLKIHTVYVPHSLFFFIQTIHIICIVLMCVDNYSLQSRQRNIGGLQRCYLTLIRTSCQKCLVNKPKRKKGYLYREFIHFTQFLL